MEMDDVILVGCIIYLSPSLLLSLLHVFGLLSQDGSVLPEHLTFDHRVKSDSLGSR